MKILHKQIQSFKKLGIGRQILILLLIVSLIPIFCIQYISYRLSTTTIKTQTGKLMEANLEQSADSIENFFRAYDSVILDIYTDSNYVKNIEPLNNWDRSKYFRARHELEESLQNITYVHKDILGIAIIGLYGDIAFYDNVTVSGERSFCFDLKDDEKRRLIKETLGEKKALYSNTFHKLDTEYGEKNYFYISHQLIDFNNYEKGPIGCILICVDEDALNRIYSPGNSESSFTLLVNSGGEVVSYSEKAYIGENIFKFSEPDKKQGIKEAARAYIAKISQKDEKKLAVYVKKIQDGAFYVINVQDLKSALSDARFVSAIIVLIGLLMGIVCLLMGIYFSEATDRSVKRILYGMDKADMGNYDVLIPEEGSHEFARISRHFNRMILRIEQYSRQERESLLREKNAEIKSLEAQINPHFLYNTLDAINWVAIERDEYTISNMLTSLAAILRYSIHKSNGIETIQNELEYLKKYIKLQQQRFNYSFLCTIEADEEILSCRIHKLLIQPLIENVIVHGFPGTTGMDEIMIRISPLDEGRVVIVVTDNGRGVAKELAEQFNQYDYKKESVESSIGVRNVITRIKLYYGETGSFYMERLDQGTKVTLTIPYE